MLNHRSRSEYENCKKNGLAPSGNKPNVTSANVDSVQYCHIVSLDHNEFNFNISDMNDPHDSNFG